MKLLREPLLHFLVIGALLFGVFQLADADDEPAPGEIVVSAGQIANLEAIFSRTWQRPPSAEELDGLVEDYIRDEVLYREAVAMGLDRDDAVIRRRMRQKMEFVADVMADVEPTDAELKTFVAEHSERFRREPHFSFSHVYFKPDEQPARTALSLMSLLRALECRDDEGRRRRRCLHAGLSTSRIFRAPASRRSSAKTSRPGWSARVPALGRAR